MGFPLYCPGDLVNQTEHGGKLPDNERYPAFEQPGPGKYLGPPHYTVQPMVGNRS